MNDIEQRRQQLLEQTRSRYSGREPVPPAIHPRYRSLYHSMYDDFEERADYPHSSFALRLGVSLILFLVFAGMDYQKASIGAYDSHAIEQAITCPADVLK